ncbi:MAG: hypothetical protein AAF330_03145 [Pseudomonadota bacterium]
MKWHFGGLSYAAAFAVAVFVHLRRPPPFAIVALGGVFAYGLGLQNIYLAALGGADHSLEALKFVVYNLTNFVILTAALRLAVDLPGDRFRLITTIAAMLLIVGFIEVHLSGRAIMDTVRAFYVSDNSLYTATLRDLERYGQLRATLLTSEPSSAANFFGALWVAYIVLAPRNWRTYALGLVLFVAGLWLIRSPALLAYAAILPAMLLFDRARIGAGLLYCVALVATVQLLALWLWGVRHDIAGGALGDFVLSGSFFVRQITPPDAALAALREAPLFGLGADYYTVARQISEIDLNLTFGGHYTPERLSEMPDGQFVTNAFWELWGAFGVVGLASVLALWAGVLRALRVPRILGLIAAFVAITPNHAGIADTFTWTPLILWTLAFSAKQSLSKEDCQAQPA